MKKQPYIYFMLLFPLAAYCQTSPDSFRLFQPLSISGTLKLGGFYRYLDGYSNEIYNYQRSSLIYGGVQLNTNSYIIHPNFLLLDAGLEYNPEKGQDLFLVVPDQSEVRTLKKLNINGTFFRQKNITIGTFANFNQLYNNRENLSNIKTNSSNWGVNLSYSNKYVPVTAIYNEGKMDEMEIQTGRTYITKFKSIEFKATKSFTTFDMNEIGYSHNDYFRQDINLTRIRNICDNIYLNDNIYFNKTRTSSLFSNISETRQSGNEAYSRFQVMENVSLKLPKEFNLNGGYNYYFTQREFQRINQHSVTAILRHQLYQSLISQLSVEYNNLFTTFYKESNGRAGIDFGYDKKIPGGHLSLSYKFYWQRQERTSEAVASRIINEEHLLADGQLELLKKANVDPASVSVKDITGTIIYQPNFDYILIPRNGYLEIQRIPGGQIPNNSTVHVDYTSVQPGSYQYDVNFHFFSASVILFKRIIEFYYRLAYQDYHNLKTTDNLTLNYFKQNIFGLRFEYRFASGGVEYELYNSTIIPYRSIRYYLILQGSCQNRFLYSLNGNMHDFYMLDDHSVQKFIDLTGKISYVVSPHFSINVELGYRKQMGQRIDLDLLIARGEIITSIRQISFRIGAETYKRDYLNEKNNFIGSFLKITRTLNWTKR